MGSVNGHVQVYLDKRLVYEGPNTFVYDGHTALGQYLAGLGPKAPGTVVVGDGTDAVTALDHYLSGERVAVSIDSAAPLGSYLTRITATVTAPLAQLTLTEMGLFGAFAFKVQRYATTGNSPTTLVDGSAPYTAGQYVGYYVQLGSGPLEEWRRITGCTTTTLTLSHALPYTPANQFFSLWEPGLMYARAPIAVVKGNAPMQVIWQLQVSL